MRIFALLLMCLSTSVFAQQERSLHTQGYAEKSFLADRAILQFEFMATAKKAKSARQDVDQQLAGALSDLKSIVSGEGALVTSQLNVSAQYDYDDRKRSFNGYQVQRSLVVTISNMENIVLVLDAVLEHSNAQISSISYSLDKPEQYSDEIRKLALINANHKAQFMATELGLKLGKPLVVSDYARPDVTLKGERYALAADAGASQVSYQGEQVKLSETVNIAYELLDSQ